jgi:hypothetical protein
MWEQIRGWWVPRTGVANFECRFGRDGCGELAFWLEPPCVRKLFDEEIKQNKLNRDKSGSNTKGAGG